MILADSITIEEFRGIRQLTLDLKKKNFAVCGPNGTGKSGIVDALEFALTGNISRLSGEGTGVVSVKEHAPHVDSRTQSEKARVVLTVYIPSLGKTVTIDRTVEKANEPTITPNTPDILGVLGQMSQHPEFVLTRRELIRYVLSTPGNRAKEVQTLLRLDRIENFRQIFQRVANSCERQIKPMASTLNQAHDQLKTALGIPALTDEVLIEAVNSRRVMLGLEPLTALTETTSVKQGLTDASLRKRPSEISKIHAKADIGSLRNALGRLAAAETAETLANITERMRPLTGDPAVEDSVTREGFLQTALKLYDGEQCPVCDTPWSPSDLAPLIKEKLRHFENVTSEKSKIQKNLESIIGLLRDLHSAIELVERYGSKVEPNVAADSLRDFRTSLKLKCENLEALVPLPRSIDTLANLTDTPEDVPKTIGLIEEGVDAIPEPSEQDAARDYLTVGHERLETVREASARLRKAQEQAQLARTVSEAYANASTTVLEQVYKEVEQEFKALYRFINREDEGNFEARLIPSMGKLGFDVDFYGRGFFPPGAYHSEGHQDSMGVCLYLALMKHLMGDSFNFAVLDDVLMSVDAGHRREVCTLLKGHFPNTQFILTTHDDIWLMHMKTAGLVEPQAAVHFSEWDVDHGPSKWESRDVWEEIGDHLKKNDVRAAAALLRHYLEYISRELCHRLRAQVAFRGDARYDLGDLLPSATSRFTKLLGSGQQAAKSWGNEAVLSQITERRLAFETDLTRTNLERWQINPAIHYNEWKNFNRQDFEPVVFAFRDLLSAFFCPICSGVLYVLPEHGASQSLRCACNATNISLVKR